jgi:uncharacterized membrane protein YfcA
MPNWFFIAAVFALAGFTKGVVGLGLPTISMGLLALVLPPAEAAALLLVPSFVTNVWQMGLNAGLRPIARRLATMMLGVCLGTWAGAGLLSHAHGGWGGMLLGLALAAYAATGLMSVRLSASPRAERHLSLLIGAATGLVSAATGVFVIPAVPYLQALGLEKEELVRALGLAFTVSTVALAVNLGSIGVLETSLIPLAALGLATAVLGMSLGQSVRRQLRPEIFRRWFFGSLLGLGVYLALESI